MHATHAELSDRHELVLTFDQNLTDIESPLGAWTDGGFGKLRYAEGGTHAQSSRVSIEYTGQLTDQLFARTVVDVIDDAEQALGATEAYLEWRRLPRSATRHRFRFGAFYPAFSLENGDVAWDSPYTRSFSAINSWLGEEVRAIGSEWSMRRPIGGPGSPQSVGALAGIFVGNDPAGTLLFWRGFSLHDRQTRLSERLPLPPLVFANMGGPDTRIERRLDPIAEIDDEPGYYAGLSWSYGQRAELSLAVWDNRADPYAFRDGQWGWGTRFTHVGMQFSLPGDIALIAQKLTGDTDWLTFVTPDGAMTPATEFVTDDIDASFLLLSKAIGDRHRVSVRFDDFYVYRPGGLESDEGTASTVAYRLAVSPRLGLQLEWLTIRSERDAWPLFYALASNKATERQVQLGFRYTLFDSTH
jgi:hypothetical protein